MVLSRTLTTLQEQSSDPNQTVKKQILTSLRKEYKVLISTKAQKLIIKKMIMLDRICEDIIESELDRERNSHGTFKKM